jgi:proline racemase
MVQTIDSHTEGNPTRVIVGGVPPPPGRTLLDKRDWLAQHDDGLRRLLNFEPRGSPMLCAVLLIPPGTPEADFGVIIMEQDEYVPMCGHCIIGAATTVVAAGMVRGVEPSTRVRFETPIGLVICDVAFQAGRVGAVAMRNVPSFVLHRDACLSVPEIGELVVDVAFGGDFYVIVDADALGIRLTPDNDTQIVTAARQIVACVNEQLTVRHPRRPDVDRCYETLFTTSATSTGDIKHAVVSPPGALDRSPCGTGTSARLASLYVRGLLGLNERIRCEGVLGTCFGGTLIEVGQQAGIQYVTPVIDGRAYLTGFHTFVLDADDPFPTGYRLGPSAKSASSRGVRA